MSYAVSNCDRITFVRSHGYGIVPRDPKRKPGIPGAWMAIGLPHVDRVCIIGDDTDELLDALYIHVCQTVQ